MGGTWLLITCLFLLLQLSFEATSSQDQRNKNVKRQIFRRRPGFFGLVSQFVRETVQDTNYAVRNITDIINNEFPSRNSLEKEGRNSTSTSGARQLSLSEVSDILGKNYQSLRRLFTTEFRNAISDSNKNIAQYKTDFRKAVRPYFTEGALTSTTTPRPSS